MRQYKSIQLVDTPLLQCYVLRHRWQLRAGLVTDTVVGGRAIVEWDLVCTGCDSHATEMRDSQGVRYPGTTRVYDLSDDYQILLNSAFTRAEAFVELTERDSA